MTTTAIRPVSAALHDHPPNVLPEYTALSRVGTEADKQDGGAYQITGTVKTTPASPTFARVRLHDRLSGRLLRETWSDKTTGAYAFTRIRKGDFYVVSFDHTGAYNAVIADRLVTELIP